MNVENIPTALTVVDVLTAGSRTAAEDGSAVDIRSFEGKIAVIVNAGDITSGASDSTYTIALLSGPDTTIGNATALDVEVVLTETGGVTVLSVDTRLADRYLFAQGAITGASSPAFPLSVTAAGVAKYA